MSRLPVPRELRVIGLVGAVVAADHEVREPPPFPVQESGLVDDLAPGAKSVLGLARAAFPIPAAAIAVGELDRDDIAPAGEELREARALVLLTLAADQLSLRILDARLDELATRGRELELREVLASQVSREVRRRVEQLIPAGLHALKYLGPCGLGRFRTPGATASYSGTFSAGVEG